MLRIDASHDALLRRALGRRFDPVTGEHYHMDSRPPPDDEVRMGVVSDADDNKTVMACTKC